MIIYLNDTRLRDKSVEGFKVNDQIVSHILWPDILGLVDVHQLLDFSAQFTVI